MFKRTVMLLSSLLIQPIHATYIIQDSVACDTMGYDNCNRQTNGELLCAQQQIQDHTLLFDVGANKGDWSAYVLKAKHQVKIYAFEPVLSSFEKLKKVFKKHPNMRLFNTALSKEAGQKTLFFYDTMQDTTELSGLYYRPILDKVVGAKPQQIAVNTHTLDAFCTRKKLERIDFLKIDTEGSELDIMLGAYELLSHKQISMLQFEYGGTYLDAGTTLEQVYTLLSSLHYTIYRIIPTGLIEIPQWRSALETFRYSNYLATATRLAV